MHETFDHTADLGLRIRAADLNTLFAEAGEALSTVLVEDVAAVRPARHLHVELAPDDREYLLFDWLRALLYHFDTERIVCSKFEVHVGDDGLKGDAWGEPMDEARHGAGHEVKAITYHGLRVEREGDGWLAEVIVDI